MEDIMQSLSFPILRKNTDFVTNYVSCNWLFTGKKGRNKE